MSYFIYWSEEGERAAAETKAGRSPRDRKLFVKILCVFVSLFSVERSVKRVKSDVCEVCLGSCGCVVSFGMGEIWIFGMHCLGRKTLPYLDSLRPRAFPCSYATVLSSPHPLFLLVLLSRDILLEHILPLPLHRPLDDILGRIDLLCRTKWIAWCLNLAELRREVRRYRRCGGG